MVRRVARAKPYIPESDIDQIVGLIRQCLCSGQLTNGELVREFEQRFAETVGVQHAVAVNTGTAALELTLRAVGVANHEVIVPTETFVASVNSIIQAGATPVFAEIHPDTYCLDLDDVIRKTTPRTRAIMLVHMAGLIVPNIVDFQNFCTLHGIDLIEDAAHAHGATHGDRKAGSLGRAGCFSFYPTKLITTAEGGMVTTNDATLARMIHSLRNHGANMNGQDYIDVSTNMRMAEPLAAIGLVQLARLPEFLNRRNVVAAIYNSGLQEISGVRPLPPTQDLCSYWNYLAVLDNGQTDRVRLATRLRETYGVEIAWPYDPPCHLQPVFRRVLGTKPGDLPQSERALGRHIALPMHNSLTDDEAHYVVESLGNALASI